MRSEGVTRVLVGHFQQLFGHVGAGDGFERRRGRLRQERRRRRSVWLVVTSVAGALVALGGTGRGGLSLGITMKFQSTIRSRQAAMTMIEVRSIMGNAVRNEAVAEPQRQGKDARDGRGPARLLSEFGLRPSAFLPGTGSSPHPPQGWQRHIRRSASPLPRRVPWVRSASSVNEGFVKDDTDYTGRALRALQELGFQLIVGAPREKATAFEDFRQPSRLHQHRPGQPRWRADLFDDHSGGPSVRPGRGVMRGPEYVLGKAQNRYRSVWRDALLGTDSGAYTVALEPPSSAAITTHASDVSAWLIRWREWAVQHPEVSACAPAPSAPSSAPSPSTPTSTSQTFPPWRASTRTPPGTGSGPAPGGISSATTRPGRRCGPGRHASSISTVTTSPPCSPPLPGSGPIRAPG